MDTSKLVEKSKARYESLVRNFPITPKRVEYGICEVKIDLGSDNILRIQDDGRVVVHHNEQMVCERYCFFQEELEDAVKALCT